MKTQVLGPYKRLQISVANEIEDQSKTQMRIGIRVRHKQFGVGSVIAIEDHGDDYKVTVRFASVGTKRLLASFAGLEPA